MKNLTRHLNESLNEAKEIVIAEKTINGLKVVVKADKKSKWYVTDAGNPVQVDDDFLLKELHLERTSPKGKKKGEFTINLKSISNSSFSKHTASDSAWVDKELRNVSPKDRGGLYGILVNTRDQGKI